jgi:hypothetical protein
MNIEKSVKQIPYPTKFNYGWVSKNVAELYNNYNSEIPIKYIEENRSEFGELTKISLDNPVRNLMWNWLKFNDTSYFTPAANAFKHSEEEVKGTNLKPKYTSHLPGTQKYRDFWLEERKRCIEGFEPEIDGTPCGIKISGELYFYWNYCRIGRVATLITGETTEVVDFPLPCAMDYYWFMELDARENPSKYGLPISYKQSIILAKARRLGFSYKNAAGATYKYTFYKEIKVAIISQTGEKGVETFEKCLQNIDFLTEYTEFGGPHITRVLDKTAQKGVIKAGTKDKKGNEKGRKSMIYTISLHNRPDKASGAGCVRTIFEEAGMIQNLAKAWTFTEPTLRSGKIYKGIAIIFGTGGDMVDAKGNAGASRDFAEMFYNPKAYKLASYKNIYEIGPDSGECGLFFNITWFREGSTFIDTNGETHEALDKNGNIKPWVAEIDLNQERKLQANKDKDAYETEITQYCKTPREAFLITSGNTFPTADIEARLDRLLTTDDLRYLSTIGSISESNGECEFRPDIERKYKAIDRFPHAHNIKNREGALVIYEQPRKLHGAIPYGAYIVSVDPIGEDSNGGESLIAVYVLKTGKYPLEIGYDEVVAQYVGRPAIDPIAAQNNIVYKLAKYYNALVTHENDRSGSEIRTYFLEKNAFEHLLKPPSDIVEQAIPNSKTNLRKTGHSMSSERMKELGEMYVNRWLKKSRGADESGRIITNLDLIRDVALLQELQNYNRYGNFDRVMAFMGAILQMRQLESNEIRDSKNAAEAMNYFDAHLTRFATKKDKQSLTDELSGMTDSRKHLYN